MELDSKQISFECMYWFIPEGEQNISIGKLPMIVDMIVGYVAIIVANILTIVGVATMIVGYIRYYCW